ncbi:MAG: DUF6232 family protein [Hyphomicrobiaceae bacterium]
MSELMTQQAPRPWEIRASAADGSGGWLRIGHRAFALRDIVGVGSTARTEPNIDGHLVMIVGFMLAGLAFVLPVVMNLARTRFLMGGVLFIGIGVMGVTEIVRRRSATLYRLEIRFRDGTRAEFATAEPKEFLALQAALAERLRTSV